MKKQQKGIPEGIHQLSLHMDKNEFKFLKMCCLKLDMSLVEFCNKAIIDKVDEWEDEWMIQRCKNDEIIIDMANEKSDPNRTVFEMEFSEGVASFKETTYANMEKDRNVV